MLRRRTDVPSLTATIASHRPIPRLPLSIDAGLQVLLVGSGASLGREGAPRQLSAALGDFGISRLSLTARDREILLACAAGAGLGAVYSVPLGGALFAARIVLGTWHPRVLGTALITSSLAVAVAFPVTHFDHVLSWPDPKLSYLFAFLALAIAPLAAAIGLGFNRVMAAARPSVQICTWVLIPTVAAAGLLTGICSICWPELPGNGRSILTVSLNSGLTLGAAAVILLLKPLLTALFLRAGAVGGMITPAMATGAAAGSLAALAINDLAGTDIHVSAVSLTCAAGVLAVTQRAPLWAALFVWELARPPYWLLIVFAIAAYAAHGLRLMRERQAATAAT
jgi:H+/Cl- antiporter ClcA